MAKGSRSPAKAAPSKSLDWAERKSDLRASVAKVKAFSKLSQSAVYDRVIELNRAYLEAAVPAPGSCELERWIVSCLPSTTPGRQSAVNMRTLEVFVIHAYDDDPASVTAFVILDGKSLGDYRLPAAVEMGPSHYRDAPSTQMRASADHAVMLECLRDPLFAQACRKLASGLMSTGRTMQWRGHNFQLADAILERKPPVDLRQL